MAKGKLKGATAIVTGASSGIGEAIAWRLAREGLNVALVARRVERLEELAARVEEAGGTAMAVSADLTEEAERLRLFQSVRDTWGQIDILVNNAGFGWYGYSTDLPWDTARAMVEVNVAAVVHLTSLALSEMAPRGSGHIVNISSVAGSIPSQGVVLYGATKAFLDSFSEGLYRELQGSGVTVSSVRPGPVQGTEFYENGAALRGLVARFGTTDDKVADRVWRLLQKPRKTVYVPTLLAITPTIERYFGWVIDRLGPLLLRRQASRSCSPPNLC
ncbi:MAG: SDR family oxidoreductase [Anaerolineales bacterium]|nr:SDR family oxidoreductase [Anaerolineales bacterium]